MLAAVVWAAMVGVAGAEVNMSASTPAAFGEGGSSKLTVTRQWNGPKPSSQLSITLTAQPVDPAVALNGFKIIGVEDPTPCTQTDDSHVEFSAPVDTNTQQDCVIEITVPKDGLTIDRQATIRFSSDDLATPPPAPTNPFWVWDDEPSFSLTPSSPGPVSEGVPVTLTVNRAGAMHYDLDPVHYTISVPGEPLLQGSLPFPAGTSSQSLIFENVNDSKVQGDRTVTVTLLTADRDQVAIPVIDDDSTAQMVSPAVSVDRTAGAVTLSVRRSDASRPATINYTVLPSTAKSNVDYGSDGGTVTFAAGQSEAQISIPLLNTMAPEERSFSVQLDDGYDDRGGTIVPSPDSRTTVVTIDPSPTVAMSLWTKKRGGLEYVALPGSSKKLVYIRVASGSPRPVDIVLTGQGLTFGGQPSTKLSIGSGSVAIVAAKLARGTRPVTVTATSAGAPLNDGSLTLARATNRVTLSPIHTLTRSAHPRTVFSGIYAGPTCKGPLVLYYSLPGARARNARVRLHLKPDAANHRCTFQGAISWSSAIFRFKRLIIQVRGPVRSSNKQTLVIRRS